MTNVSAPTQPHLNPKTIYAIVLGVLIPSIVFIVIIVVVCLWRRRSVNRPIGYSKVNDDLDEEEIEFKRMLESKHGGDEENGRDDEDYEDVFSPESMKDFDFSAQDKDRLSMLENLRNNLMKGAGGLKDGSEGGDEEGGGSESEKMRL
eukprot:gene27857-33639_t